jgi:hypothetical protein
MDPSGYVLLPRLMIFPSSVSRTAAALADILSAAAPTLLLLLADATLNTSLSKLSCDLCVAHAHTHSCVLCDRIQKIPKTVTQ